MGYAVPGGPFFIRDNRGRKAGSFSGRAVTNDTAPGLLTGAASAVPDSHYESSVFNFQLRFSEEPHGGFSYKTLRDHAFTVTGGAGEGASAGAAQQRRLGDPRLAWRRWIGGHRAARHHELRGAGRDPHRRRQDALQPAGDHRPGTRRVGRVETPKGRTHGR